MQAKSLILAIALVTALLTPGLAQADVLDNQLAQLRPVVAQWWASQGLTATPCDSVEFSRATFPGTGIWAETLEGTDLTGPPPWEGWTIPVCHVVFNEVLASATPAKVCTVVLHEWGHILGLGHSLDPTNIMYGAKLIDPPPVCAAWGAPPRKGVDGPVLARGRGASRAHMRRVMAMSR